ncbi:glycerophosphodiester phosphodiesterase family protein [Phaeobacter sp. QD34_3]|uniref:glycerophosphodiester phosphodiesterase family protein n=1 Tax=unclassified Phaeobacter TaxID=2621772 RepID=UPI00237F8B42|nr:MULTISPECIES: glycerophosphodiester phosphodiesterase family protein [unclassified Phaeobacter]MDE4132999.1 glycerophosphodiester phosphodiesterase family protein [Phaeobacter sp. QD34_3]MDE4136599.1 glycerophosphodiester phosphodiesterase family protein [Phaeobacter sp. QD34_24]
MQLPKIFGHRGAPDVLPENSLEGFAHTIASGADGIELDVLLTRDGVPVVTHNHRLMADTTRDASGAFLTAEGPAISALTFDELCAFDVGGIRPGSEQAKKHPQQQDLPGTRVPRLAEVLDLVAKADRSIDVLVELKHDPEDGSEPKPADFVRAATEVIAATGTEEACLIHAFNWQILSAARDHAPGFRRSHLSMSKTIHPSGNLYEGSPWLDGASSTPEAMLRDLADRGATVWSPLFWELTPDQRALARDLGLQVMVWTLRGEAAIRKGLAADVDGVITDDPALAVRLRDDMLATGNPAQ